jgi:7-cyano-7-deazaguanine synthase
MNTVVMALSGGMDSATLLGYYLSQGYNVFCCLFRYGSKHNIWENIAAENIIMHYEKFGFSFDYRFLNITPAMEPIQSSLLKSSPNEIPEGHYAADNMKQTVVPGRNLIFASIMAGIAESIGASIISLGMHSGDHHIYPDCRPDFIYSLSETIRLSSDGYVYVSAPFMYKNKKSILGLGYSLDFPVPYHLTRTCYKDQQKSCGKCGSCNERLEAFESLGIKDPIDYE